MAADRAEPKELEVILDRTSPIPLYHQLAQAIETAITSGELSPGDRLENELAMTARLGLARPTARQAIGELAKKGLVVRKRGVGTQVLNGQISRETKLSSLNDDLVNAGRAPSTQLLSYSIGPLEPELMLTPDLSDLDENTDYIHIRRLRFAEDSPLAILTNYLPGWLEIDADALSTTGLYAILRARGINLQVARQSVGARLMQADEARWLSERRPAPCLTALRRTYDDSGRLIEIGQHVYRASHYSLDVSLVP